MDLGGGGLIQSRVLKTPHLC